MPNGKRKPRAQKQPVKKTVRSFRTPVKTVNQTQQRPNNQPKRTRRSKEKVNIAVAGVPSSTSLPKTDIRLAASANKSLVYSGQVSSITISKEIDLPTLWWVAIGWVSRAYERGLNAFGNDDFTAFYAVQYCTGILLNFSQGKFVPSTELPYWLLCLCHALSPKTVPFEQGKASYQFVLGGTASVPVNCTVGFIPYGYTYSMGKNGGAAINSFPTVVATGSAYSEDKGALAFNQVCQFMVESAATKKEKKISRMVSSSLATPFLQDVSCFGYFAKASGLGSTGAGGGQYGQLWSEVPVLHPILALATCGGDTSLPIPNIRNFNWAPIITGDPCLLGAVMSTMLSTRQLSMKRNIRVKAIDFLEFADVLAQWMQKIVQAYFNDNVGLLDDTYTNAQCGLTLQEMQLLLRAVMMSAFKESQAAVQGLYPFTPATDTDNQFVPFVSGVNCCSIGTPGMQIPVPIIENIRALTARQINYGGSAQDIRWYFPILGKYATDVLDPDGYVATYTDSAGVEHNMNVFNASAFFQREEKDLKGNIKKTVFVESPIDLIDGSSGVSLVFINDTTQLAKLTVLWNDWLKGSGVESYSVKVGTYGNELGINALCSIAMTRTWLTAIGENPHITGRERRDSTFKHDKVIDLRFHNSKFRGMEVGAYATRQALIETSQGDFLSVPYQEVQQLWILPVNEQQAIINVNSTVFQRYQSMFGEPNSIPKVASSEGVSLAAMHNVYAAKCTKAKLAEKSDWMTMIDEMAAQGRGGILSGIVAGLVGGAFPSVAGVAHSIADSLPI